ncbi:hypothetical protein [Streptomyces sp. NPDC090053]|uniref:hypothetical protein n=1 Tax=Streptomyces sp. NPDC090053 TaxID=3365932 RepID=UPI003808B92C
MVAVDDATAAELLGRPVSSQDETMRRLAASLSRSLAAEGIAEDLIDMLEDVLRDRPDAAAAVRYRTDDLLVRLGLPLPRRPRPPKRAPSLSDEEAARISTMFGRATTQLVQIVPHRVAEYPTEELRLLVALRDERPAPGETLAHLRRYGLAILDLLDLMGDDA